MFEEIFFWCARRAFDLAAPLLEAERRWNWNECDITHALENALLELEDCIND